MNLCRIATHILIVIALLISAVVAQETGSHDYIVISAGGTGIEENPPFMPMTVGSIKQCDTNWYSTNIVAGEVELIVDLNWGDPSNSLRLRIYAPDAVLGPYYDAYDGVDGRIRLRIKDSVGLYPGTWRFEIYGDRVTGTQDYTILT